MGVIDIYTRICPEEKVMEDIGRGRQTGKGGVENKGLLEVEREKEMIDLSGKGTKGKYIKEH